MGLIWLLTPQHTGTHFLRLLLEINYTVNYTVFQDQFFEDGVWEREWGDNSPLHPTPHFLDYVAKNHPTHRYCTGKIDLNEYQEIVAQNRRQANVDWTHLMLGPTGIVPESKMLRWGLVHAHGDFFDLGCPVPPLNKWSRAIVTIRDPLLSICSGLRRFGDPDNARRIIRGFMWLVDYPCFKFCIDQYKTRLEKDTVVKDLFKYLEIPITGQCRKYAKLWPAVNETVPEIENFQSLLTKEQLRDLRRAKKLYEEERRIHPILQPWVEELRATGIQPYLEKLNYIDLPWYK